MKTLFANVIIALGHACTLLEPYTRGLAFIRLHNVLLGRLKTIGIVLLVLFGKSLKKIFSRGSFLAVKGCRGS